MKYNLVNENFKENYGENILKARGINDDTTSWQSIVKTLPTQVY